MKLLYNCDKKFGRMGRKISRTFSLPNMLSLFVDKAEYKLNTKKQKNKLLSSCHSSMVSMAACYRGGPGFKPQQ